MKKVFIDTIQKYSGGYVTYLKGLLSSRAIPVDISVIVHCSSGLAKDLGMLDSNVQLIVDNSLKPSILHKRKWQRGTLPKLLKANKADVLFIPSNAIDFIQRQDIPVVTMCMNVQPFSIEEVRRYGYNKTRIKLEVLKRVMIKSFERADGVIFHSEYAKDLVSLYARVKWKRVISIGIRAEFKQPHPKMPLNKDGDIKLLYVSSLFLYKHQWNVILAVEKLRKVMHRNISVDLVVGNGEAVAASKLSRIMASMEDSGFINFIDNLPVPYKDLHNVYKNCDIFVFASSCENFPNILLEGMATGLPIASSDVAPMPEILKDGGLYFSPYDPDSIANTIRRLIEDPAMGYEYAKKAHAYAKEYSWERCAIDTFAFLRDVVGQYKNSKQR